MQKKYPHLTVDALIIEKGKIVLVKRKNPPYKGFWALPGGFVEYGETVEDAVKREVREETGLGVEILKLVGVYSDPKRDPRGHVITVVFLCRPVNGVLHADSDAKEAGYHSLSNLPELAFDHKRIVGDALK
jgi:8-oxo-dGTP diphosphatase